MRVVKNFVFSSTTSQPYTYYFYNTSDNEFKNYLQLSSYNIDWGDGSSGTITTFSPNYQSHNYLTSGEYTITLSQTNPWGINTIKKTIVVPFTGTTIPNPNGTAQSKFWNNSNGWQDVVDWLNNKGYVVKLLSKEGDRINFPDYQWRIYKNIPTIKWINKVHERLNGFKIYSTLPPLDEFCLLHPKTIERQEKQNEFYNTL